MPVKEKLMLFESLCRLGRKVRSSEDVTTVRLSEVETTKRARSLHDLSSCVAVREMCRWVVEVEGEWAWPRKIQYSQLVVLKPKICL